MKKIITIILSLLFVASANAQKKFDTLSPDQKIQDINRRMKSNKPFILLGGASLVAGGVIHLITTNKEEPKYNGGSAAHRIEQFQNRQKLFMSIGYGCYALGGASLTIVALRF